MLVDNRKIPIDIVNENVIIARLRFIILVRRTQRDIWEFCEPSINLEMLTEAINPIGIAKWR